MIEAFKQTPWWVYVLFIYLLMMGVKALKPRVIKVKKVFILPAIFLLWSIYSLVTRVQGYSDVLLWVVFIVLGCVIGWRIMQPQWIRADKKKLLISMRGSSQVLVLSMTIFAIKYFFGYYYATHPESGHPVVLGFNFMVSGGITGMFIGRMFCLLNKFKRAEHHNLKESK